MENPYEQPHPISELISLDALIVEAQRMTFWPGMAMVIQGVVIALLYAVVFSAEIYARGIFRSSGESLLYVIAILPLILVWCGLAMVRLTSRRLSYAGAALSLFLFLPVGLFIGIWALIVLDRLVVREAFRKISNPDASPAS